MLPIAIVVKLEDEDDEDDEENEKYTVNEAVAVGELVGEQEPEHIDETHVPEIANEIYLTTTETEEVEDEEPTPEEYVIDEDAVVAEEEQGQPYAEERTVEKVPKETFSVAGREDGSEAVGMGIGENSNENFILLEKGAQINSVDEEDYNDVVDKSKGQPSSTLTTSITTTTVIKSSSQASSSSIMNEDDDDDDDLEPPEIVEEEYNNTSQKQTDYFNFQTNINPHSHHNQYLQPVIVPNRQSGFGKKCHNLSICELRKKLSFCPICQIQYGSHKMANMCLSRHGKRQCWLCLEVLSARKDEFSKHCIEHHSVSNSGDIVGCPYCGKCFDFRQGLNQHIVKIHFSESISDMDAVASLSPTTLVDIFTGKPRSSVTGSSSEGIQNCRSGAGPESNSSSGDGSLNYAKELLMLSPPSTNKSSVVPLFHKSQSDEIGSSCENLTKNSISLPDAFARPSVITLTSGNHNSPTVKKMFVPPEQPLNTCLSSEEIGGTSSSSSFDIISSQHHLQEKSFCPEENNVEIVENTSFRFHQKNESQNQNPPSLDYNFVQHNVGSNLLAQMSKVTSDPEKYEMALYPEFSSESSSPLKKYAYHHRHDEVVDVSSIMVSPPNCNDLNSSSTATSPYEQVIITRVNNSPLGGEVEEHQDLYQESEGNSIHQIQSNDSMAYSFSEGNCPGPGTGSSAISVPDGIIRDQLFTQQPQVGVNEQFTFGGNGNGEPSGNNYYNSSVDMLKVNASHEGVNNSGIIHGNLHQGNSMNLRDSSNNLSDRQMFVNPSLSGNPNRPKNNGGDCLNPEMEGNSFYFGGMMDPRFLNNCGVKRRILMKAMWDEHNNQFHKRPALMETQQHHQQQQSLDSMQTPSSFNVNSPHASLFPPPPSHPQKPVETATFHRFDESELKQQNQAQSSNYVTPQGEIVKHAGTFFEQYVRQDRNRMGDHYKLLDLVRPAQPPVFTNSDRQNSPGFATGWTNNGNNYACARSQASRAARNNSLGGIGGMSNNRATIGSGVMMPPPPPQPLPRPSTQTQWQAPIIMPAPPSLPRPQFTSPHQMYVRKAPNPAFWDNLRARLLAQSSNLGKPSFKSGIGKPQGHFANKTKVENVVVMNPFEEDLNRQRRLASGGSSGSSSTNPNLISSGTVLDAKGNECRGIRNQLRAGKEQLEEKAVSASIRQKQQTQQDCFLRAAAGGGSSIIQPPPNLMRVGPPQLHGSSANMLMPMLPPFQLPYPPSTSTRPNFFQQQQLFHQNRKRLHEESGLHDTLNYFNSPYYNKYTEGYNHLISKLQKLDKSKSDK